MSINHGICQAGHEWHPDTVSTWRNYVPQVGHLLLAQPHSLSYDGFMKWVLIIFIEWVLIIFIIFVIFIIFHQVEINDSQLGSFCSEGEADQLTTSKTHASDETGPSISSNLCHIVSFLDLHSVRPLGASNVTVSPVSLLNFNLTLHGTICIK